MFICKISVCHCDQFKVMWLLSITSTLLVCLSGCIACSWVEGCRKAYQKSRLGCVSRYKVFVFSLAFNFIWSLLVSCCLQPKFAHWELSLGYIVCLHTCLMCCASFFGSLQITPACNLPLRTVRAGGKMVIVNLQVMYWSRHVNVLEFIWLVWSIADMRAMGRQPRRTRVQHCWYGDALMRYGVLSYHLGLQWPEAPSYIDNVMCTD